MSIGAFSISLAVKDIHKSKNFYENIGFKVFGGEIEKNWLILQNEDVTIGLFQDMFEKNILTFNPGWTNQAKQLQSFKDIRELQKEFEDKGISILQKVETESGPGSFTLEDPDGNPILIDQFV